MKCPVYFAGPSVDGYTLNDNLPPECGGDVNTKTCRLVGDCLEPMAINGEIAHLVEGEPKPWQLVGLWLKGEAAGRFKVYVTTVARAEGHNPMWGERQPDKIVIVATLNPLALIAVAAHDIERMAPVTMLETPFWEKDVSGGLPLDPEQYGAIKAAMAA